MFKVGDWVVDKHQHKPYQIKTQSVANAYNSDIEQATYRYLKEISYHNCLTLGKFIGFRGKEQ